MSIQSLISTFSLLSLCTSSTDEAELALKNMDKGKKGELSKDEMYQLMRENLKTQHSLFKMKKIVMA